ncbi:MAG: ester cyclase [archaeon]|nr:ester cyclase [archaeon]MCP8320584.1 ester cyclase [archaeon]
MSLEENKAIVRRLFEVFNKHNLALLDELIALDYVDHPRQLRGLESYKQHLTMFYKSFPDTLETVEDIIAEGDKVWIHLKGTATHTGEYRGLAPTGKKTTWEAVCIWRIVDGKIVEMWFVADELDFLKQLGVIEYKGFPDEVK